MHSINVESSVCRAGNGSLLKYGGPIALVLIVILTLSGCSSPTENAAGRLEGRWQKTGASALGEPDLLISEYLEFREDGQVVVLLHDETPDQYWTVGLGHYVLRQPGQIELAGRCWKGYESFDCTRIYRLEVSNDRLTISTGDASGRQVEYRRTGNVSHELPPTLVPPAPTPLPADADS